MSSNVITVSREELEARRIDIERAIGMTHAELREMAEATALSSEQWIALDELDNLNFLLGPDVQTS